MIDRSRPILVTGAGGFAGSYVVRELIDQGYKVVGFDVNDYRPESRFIIGDRIGEIDYERGSLESLPRVLEVAAKHRPGAIVHLGAVMDVALLHANPEIAYRVNVGGTVNVFEAARHVGVEGPVIIFSTIAVIPEKQYEPIDARHPVILPRKGPHGAYSAAKLACEAFGYAYQQSFGIDFRCIRPSALYGFGMSWFAPNYMKNIVEPAVLGQPVRLSSGGPVPRDYAYVVDVATLVRAILEGPSEDVDRILYAGTGRELTTGGDVGRIVRELVPGSVVEIAEAWTESDLEELPFRGRIDISNALELGWRPQFSDVRDGIADYIGRFRAFIAAGGGSTSPGVTDRPVGEAPGAGT
jgi:nucleoside-diphosphate-sugar epimerase